MMTKKIYKFSSLVLALIFTNSVFADEALNTQNHTVSLRYRLQPGDSLSISVWGEDTMQYKDLRVLPDGTISYPLTGTILVHGKTIEEISLVIADKLKQFIPDPQVTVMVGGIDGNHAYIIGKVAKSGPIPLYHDTTVMQALSMSGALDKFADRSAIKIIRNNGGKTEVLNFNYDEIEKGQHLETNIILKSGDTVVVP